MNSVHDMGGMHNFGPIDIEANEPVFHDDWERRIFALMIGVLPAGYFNIDEMRRTVESIPPATYLSAGYYEKWLYAMEMIMVEKGIVSPEELKQGQSLQMNEDDILPAVKPEMVKLVMSKRTKVQVETEVEARFKPGDHVITRNMHPRHHTRIPRYARGKQGQVVEDNGVFLLADTKAHGGPNTPEHVYSVRFSAQELWGEDAPATDSVCINLFDSYLQRLTKT